MGTTFNQPVVQADPVNEPDKFRRCMGTFGTGVTVVTASVGDKLVGMTANSFSSVSLDPPLVLWSVKKSSESFPTFNDAKHFAINILALDQTMLSRHFGKSGDDKFADVEWTPGINGSPLLDGSVSHFECTTFEKYEGGDHIIMVGKVDRFTQHDRELLLFANGRYGMVRGHPDAVQKLNIENAENSENAPGVINNILAGLMYRAYGTLSRSMEADQRAVNLDPVTGRMLGVIQTYPGKTLEFLLDELFVGSRVAEEALEELRDAGFVAVSEKGEIVLTVKGEDKLHHLAEVTRSHENDLLAGLSQADIDASRRVFRHLIAAGKARK